MFRSWDFSEMAMQSHEVGEKHDPISERSYFFKEQDYDLARSFN